MTLMEIVFKRPNQCTEGVIRRGVYEPCDMEAVAVRIDPGEHAPYPVCKRHVRGDMVSLATVLAAVEET